MRIVVLDDYQDAFRTLSCFARLAGHEVQVFHNTVKEPAALATRLGDAEAALLIQQRSAVPRAVIEQLPGLKLISQTGRNVSHIDLPTCTEHGIVVSAGGAGSPNATAELTWGLILAALRHIPQEVERLKAGLWLGSNAPNMVRMGSPEERTGLWLRGGGKSVPRSPARYKNQRPCAAEPDLGWRGPGPRSIAP